MEAVLVEVLAQKDLTRLLQFSPEDFKSESFRAVYSEIQDLAWQKACSGEIKETVALQELLLTHGIDLFRHTTVTQSLLHEAVLKASYEVLAQILSFSLVNDRNSAGQTALMVLLSHSTEEQFKKAQLFAPASLACDLRLRTTCHYVLSSSLPSVCFT